MHEPALVAAVRRGLAVSFRGRPRLTLLLLCTLALVAWTSTAAVAWFTWDVTTNLPGRQALRELGDMAQATRLFDRAGTPVFTIFREQRIEVPLAEVSPMVTRAVVAIEDQRFHAHRGIDAIRVVGAILANLRSGRKAQGGSTITQQLARQSFLTRDKTWRRKLQEMLLAAQIEHAYSKDQILELYLNKVYFGDGFYGIEAAARGYFGKPAKDLGVAEAALLAGLIQSPSAYAPSGNMERAVARRASVLQAMLDTGVIDRDTYEQARQAPVTLVNGLQRDEAFGLYFKEAVRRELVQRFGWERVSEGGLRVYTTIDPALQQQAERLVEESLRRVEARPGYPHASRADTPVVADQAPSYLQGAAVVMDPRTCEVLALVGGREFRESRFNRATQARRQPGSAFKPIVYAAAIEGGLSPSSVLAGLDDPIYTPAGAWIPEDEHSDASAMTLRAGLRNSSNRAAARLIRDVGLESAMKMVERLRLGPLPAVPSIALGSGEVTLADLTAAYAAFANGGTVRSPRLITRVEDSAGTLIFANDGQPERAMSERTAFLLASMLQDVINAGTGARARGLGFSLPAAGKTGTTNDYLDAWFVGFTPAVVTGVWVGFDKPRTIMRNAYAGDVAVPMWTAVMKVATAGQAPEWIKRPDGLVGVQLCRLSGKLAVPGCQAVETTDGEGDIVVRSMVYTEYFSRGAVPSDTCDLHQGEALVASAGEGATTLSAATPIVPASVSPGAIRPESAAADARQAPGENDRANAATPEAPKKKRGFWSRLFGIGGDKDDKKPQEKPPKPPQPPQ